MALAIRLARGGMKKRPIPHHRHGCPQRRDGKFLEKIGTYNPLLAKDNPERVKLDAERAGYWASASAPSRRTVSRASSMPPASAPAPPASI